MQRMPSEDNERQASTSTMRLRRAPSTNGSMIEVLLAQPNVEAHIHEAEHFEQLALRRAALPRPVISLGPDRQVGLLVEIQDGTVRVRLRRVLGHRHLDAITQRLVELVLADAHLGTLEVALLRPAALAPVDQVGNP